MTDEVDDADAVQSVEHKLDRERREQETEDLLGHEHAALIQMITDAVCRSKHGNIERQHDGEHAQHHCENCERVRLG